MYISKINASVPTISYPKVKNERTFKGDDVQKKTSCSICDEYTSENCYSSDECSRNTTIFGLEEILKLKDFALKCKDNVALKIVQGPICDLKFVKSQTDLIDKTGEWLDITDCGEL